MIPIGLSLALLTLASSPDHFPRREPSGPPTIRLPATLTIAPGRMLRLQAETTGSQVRWAVASEDVDLVSFPDGKLALFCCATPGRYLVFAWKAAGDQPSEAARCLVTVATGPTPPPLDPFAASLRELFARDSTPDKSVHLAQLAAVYREAIGFTARTDVRTAGELAARIRNAVGSLLPAEALVEIRQRIGEEIARNLPVDAPQDLDEATRKKASKLFERIAVALEETK